MKKLLCAVLVLMLALSGCALAITDEEAAAIAASVTETTTDASLITSPFVGVIDNVKSSVVGVNNYQNYTSYSGSSSYYGFGFGGSRGSGKTETVEKLYATGSGVVVYEHLVLTNYHVVEDATRLTVQLDSEDETEYECTLVSYDEGLDVAVLYAPELEAAAVPLGDSDQMQVGEWVLCIGNPLSDELSGTVTTGIVSALDREISSTTTTDKYGLKTKVVNSMIQIDAAINSGNSGGGMFNTLGQMMGIPTLKYSGSTSSGTTVEGIGMCIPINSAKSLINESIIKVLTGETGDSTDVSGAETATSGSESDKPMIGITGVAVSSSNYYLVYSGMLPAGVMVSEVVEDGPAAKAGVQAYDVIVEIEGNIVTSVTDIRDVLNEHSYGDSVSIKLYRLEGLDGAESLDDLGDGQYIDLEVELFAFSTEEEG